MKTLHTVDDVAEHFGITAEQVIARCKAKPNGWPHIRPARPSRTWRFTDEDLESIEKLIARRALSVDSWGRATRRSA